MRLARLGCIALLSLAACGERPQRIEEAPASAAPKAAPVVKFAGSVRLEGDLAGAKAGALFVSARRKGQRLPTLSHRFDMSDPAWAAQDGARVLTFALTDADNMGGFGAPMGNEMEVEARYSPSGFIDPRPGAEEAGVVRGSVPAVPGDANLSIRLQPTTSK